MDYKYCLEILYETKEETWEYITTSSEDTIITYYYKNNLDIIKNKEIVDEIMKNYYFDEFGYFDITKELYNFFKKYNIIYDDIINIKLIKSLNISEKN